MIDINVKDQRSNPTEWKRVEYFESDKGVVRLEEGEWVAWVKLQWESGARQIQQFKLSGADGNTYASADAAKSAVERTWARHGGKYGK